MNIDDCFELGHFTKTSGYKGELNVFFDVDDPLYYKGLDMMFIDLKEGLIPFPIEHLTHVGKQKFRVKLDGIDTFDDAVPFVKKRIFLPLEILPELEDNQFYYHEVIGWKVVDVNHGELGIIKEIAENHANPLIVVQHGKKQILLPMLDEFFINVDRKANCLHYKAPEGLVELYLEEDKDQDRDQ